MQRGSMDEPSSNLRIARLGGAGSGKSSSGNTILGRNAFRVHTSPYAAQRPCELETAMVEDWRISVIDTPALFNTSMAELKTEMWNCARLSFPGLHVFLLVIRLDVRLTEEERNIVKWIRNTFGNKAVHYTFILFTHADQLCGEPLDEFIRRSFALQFLINSCNGRYHTFNNTNRENRDQVTELIQKIKRMVQNNRRHHNTLDEFQRTENSCSII